MGVASERASFKRARRDFAKGALLAKHLSYRDAD